MARRVKGLSIAFFAVAAMSMAVAAGAQATQIHATTTSEQAVLHGDQYNHNTFITDAGQVVCQQGTFEGTAAKTATNEVSITGTYTGCQAFGQVATIDMNGCKYVLTGKNPQTGATIGGGTVNVDITGCTSGKSIEITTGICRVTVPQQHNKSHIVLTNNSSGSPHDVTADVTVTGIHYILDGPICPTAPNPPETRTNGVYNGQITIQAYESLGQQQITHNGHQYNRHTRSAAKGLMVT